jgi:hypothetical protein
VSSELSRAVSATTDGYTAGDVLPVGDWTIPRGTNLLVSGPTTADTREVATRLLARGCVGPEHTITVTTDRSADQLLDDFERAVPDAVRSRANLVDATGTKPPAGHDAGRIETVSTPEDLTGIGLGIVKCNRNIGIDASEGVRFGMLSVSTLLQFASEQRVFRFLHAFTGRVSAAGYLGVYAFDPTLHDPVTVDTISSLFDRTVELRERDDGSRESRLLGGDPGHRTWVQF